MEIKRNVVSRFLLLWVVGMLLSVQVFAQGLTVKGVVKDNTGMGVIGANILVKGTTNGTITDFDGNFTLEAKKGDVIVISFIGYKTQELPAAATMNVTLQDDTEVLDDVVVIGYGSVKKNDATGSVTAIKPDELSKGITTNAQDMLAGKVAGVSVISNDGTPGGGAQIRIRGGSSLNASNDPLIVIDGLAIDNNGIKGMSNGLSMVNPEDIETFTVLKDASATAIYGSRASNGVIIITTKKGKNGQAPKVSYNGSVSVSTIQKRYDVLDGDEYRAYAQQIFGDELPASLGTASTDWQDEIFRTGITQNYKVAVSSGNDKTQFYLSGNYMGQTGVVIESKNERYQAKANVTSQVTPWLHVTADINASHNIRKGGSFATGKDNPIWIAMNYSPTMQMMDGNNYAKDPINSIASNPVGILRLQGGETMTDVFTGHVDLRFNLAKGLTFTTTNGVDYYDAKSYSFSSKRVNPSNSMGNSDTYRMMLQSSNNFTYMGT